MTVGKGDLRTIANGLFPTGSVNPPTPEGRDEIRDAVDVILRLSDYRTTKLSLALEQLNKAAAEIERLRAMLTWIKEHNPAIVRSAEDKFRR